MISEKIYLSKIHGSILEALAYFDIFSYPLKESEILFFLPTLKENIKQELNDLIEKKLVFKIDEFYSLKSDKSSIERRLEGNKQAELYLPLAKSKAHFIAKFPFVKGVAISGSMSKKYYDKNSDFDFFVITDPGRLWLARSILVFYKKIFLFNSRKYFCVNYFLDTEHLNIEEKNLFTATEITTLLPVSGKKTFQDFFTSNNWITEFLPNARVNDLKEVNENPKNLIKTWLEKILKTFLGEMLDEFFMKLTFYYWKNKFEEFNQKQLNIALKSRKYVSKHHPQNFQQKVLNALDEKVNAYKNFFN